MTLPSAIQEAIRLPDGSIPQSCQATHDPEAVDRRTDCRRVSQCVSLAVARKWPALSCGMCPVHDRMNRDELRQEMHGIAEMLREARIWEHTTAAADRCANKDFRKPGRYR